MRKMSLHFRLPVAILRERSRYVAYTPALDLSTSGRTYAETQKRFVEAASVFLEEVFEKGTANEVLYDLGWKRIKRTWQPPVLVSQKSEEVRVPV